MQPYALSFEKQTAEWSTRDRQWSGTLVLNYLESTFSFTTSNNRDSGRPADRTKVKTKLLH